MWPLANRGKNAGDCLGGPERPANSVHAGSRIAAAATGSCTSVALNHNHLDCAQLATSGTSAAAPTTSTTVQDDFLRRLLQKRTTIDAKKLNSLQKATFLGNVPKSKALIAERNRDVNKLDSYHGFTALHVAAEFNKFEIAGLLVNPSSALDGKGMDVQMLKASFSVSSLKRCDPNIVNADGRTALALAVIHKNFDIVKLLLENKANTTIQDKAGCTAMHYAIALNDLPVVKLLLDNGANVEHLDHSRMSLLQHSILCDHVEIAELLAGLGAMINYCSASGGSSPLQMALDKGWNRLVKILLGKGADTTSLDAQSQQALERLEKEGSNSEFSATLRRKSTRKPLGRRKSVSVPLSVGGGQYLDSEDPRRPTEPGEGSNPTRKKSVRRRNTFDPSDFEGDATGQRRLSGLRPPSIEEEKLAYNETMFASLPTRSLSKREFQHNFDSKEENRGIEPASSVEASFGGNPAKMGSLPSLPKKAESVVLRYPNDASLEASDTLQKVLELLRLRLDLDLDQRSVPNHGDVDVLRSVNQWLDTFISRNRHAGGGVDEARAPAKTAVESAVEFYDGELEAITELKTTYNALATQILLMEGEDRFIGKTARLDTMVVQRTPTIEVTVHPNNNDAPTSKKSLENNAHVENNTDGEREPNALSTPLTGALDGPASEEHDDCLLQHEVTLKNRVLELERELKDEKAHRTRLEGKFRQIQALMREIQALTGPDRE